MPMLLSCLFIHVDETRLHLFLCIVVAFKPGRSSRMCTQPVIIRDARLYCLSAVLRIHITAIVNRESGIYF